MAYIVLNSKFKPFSYSEMVQPMMMATEAHQQAENNYGDLTLEANKMEALINSQSDSKSYGMYKKYADDLKAQAEELSSKGLTLNSRKNLNNIRARYGSEIEPIKAASNEYAKMIETRQQLSSRGSGVVFKNKYSSVDDFLGGRKADNEYLSEKDIIATAGAEFQAYSQTLLKDPEFTKILGGQKYQMLQKSGYSPEAITQVLMGDPAAQPKLKEMYEAKWKSLGADAYAPEDQEKIKGALSTAMYAGLQKPVVNYMNNEEYVNAAQRKSYQLQLDTFEYNKLRDKMSMGAEPIYTSIEKGKGKNEKGEEIEIDIPIKHFNNSEMSWDEKNGERVNVRYHKKNQDGADNELTATQKSEKAAFSYQDITGNSGTQNSFTEKNHNKDFDVNHAVLFDYGKFSAPKQKQIREILQKKRMNLDEVDIYRDDDIFKDDFRIVRKGYPVDGSEPTPEQLVLIEAAKNNASQPAGIIKK